MEGNSTVTFNNISANNNTDDGFSMHGGTAVINTGSFTGNSQGVNTVASDSTTTLTANDITISGTTLEDVFHTDVAGTINATYNRLTINKTGGGLTNPIILVTGNNNVNLTINTVTISNIPVGTTTKYINLNGGSMTINGLTLNGNATNTGAAGIEIQGAAVALTVKRSIFNGITDHIIDTVGTGTVTANISHNIFNTIASAKFGVACRTNATCSIINNVFYDEATKDGKGIYAQGTLVVKNNEFMNLAMGIQQVAGTPTVDYNGFYGNTAKTSGTVTSTNEMTSDPLFQTGTYIPDPTSPAIDSGTDVSLTTDYAGNPIYGTPDIGAYEYQPPYTVGSNAIPQTGSVRIYSNGKYRALVATTTADTIATSNFSVVPAGGGYYTASTSAFMDLNINTWETAGDKNKSWTATSTEGAGNTHATSTVYTIGDLAPDSYYTFKIDNTATTTAITGYGATTCQTSYGNGTNLTCLSDSSGIVQFTYSGGYSTHTFELEKDITSPASFTASSPANNTVNSDSRPTLSWNASSDTESGIAKYQLYIDNTLDSDNISNIAASQTPGQNLSCGSHSWYVIAVDNNGNTTNSNTFNYTRDCNTIPVYLLNSQNSNSATANTGNDSNNDTSPGDDAAGDDSEGSDVSDNQENKTATRQNSVETPRRGISTLEKLMSEAKEIVAAKKDVLTNFITNGTDTTKILGSGERSGVVNSFKSAYGRNPATEIDWQDIIKIANGRWPAQKNEKTEANASAAFKKIYLRLPDKNNPRDQNAIAVISYGLRPTNRNLNSEKKSIQFFKNIYGYAPKSAMAWDIVRAIAYSGAKR
jgi:hypothetical protein